jgi:hypothetical protein
MHKPRLVPFALALLALTLAACATVGERMDRLERTLAGFEKAVRWGQFEAAYSFRQWPPGVQPTLPANLKNIRVTAYDATNLRLDAKRMTAWQTVTIRYYDLDTSVVHSVQHSQEWRYEPDEDRWYLVSEMPAFK